MYDEICKLTFESVAMCSDLEDYLLGRLAKKSPHVKAKVSHEQWLFIDFRRSLCRCAGALSHSHISLPQVCKILKYLAEKGHDSFRQDLQRRTEEIRAAMAHRGPPDPLHGDTFNTLVRTNASVRTAHTMHVFEG